MGNPHLWQLLRDISQLKVIRGHDAHKAVMLEVIHKKVAVDVSIWISEAQRQVMEIWS
jgi:hypothetical protein